MAASGKRDGPNASDGEGDGNKDNNNSDNLALREQQNLEAIKRVSMRSEMKVTEEPSKEDEEEEEEPEPDSDIIDEEDIP